MADPALDRFERSPEPWGVLLAVGAVIAGVMLLWLAAVVRWARSAW